MTKGYQVIEPDLYNFSKAFKDINFEVAILYWLVHQLQLELKDQLIGITIHVIKVGHHSPNNTYPALGIYYENRDDPRNVEPLIEITIKKIFQQKSVSELLYFIGNKTDDWEIISKKLME